MNYTAALEKLGKRDSRKLCNNTYLERCVNGDIAVKLHGTDVLTFKPDNSTVYNSGGWRTVTTKSRMNGYGPDGFFIWQDKGIWTLGRVKGPRKLYEDGIIVTARGKITGGGNIQATKAQKRLKKRVDVYCKAFALALVEGKVPAPGAGDCFYCQMKVAETGVPLGDATENHEHLLLHIKENYFVPGLLYNAVQAPNAPISIIVKSCIDLIWNGKPILDGLKSLIIPQVTKTLRKYIKHRLGMVV